MLCQSLQKAIREVLLIVMRDDEFRELKGASDCVCLLHRILASAKVSHSLPSMPIMSRHGH